MGDGHQRRIDPGRHGQRSGHEAAVVRRAAGLDAVTRQLQRTRQRGQGVGHEHEPGARRTSHLEAMPEQPEPRHVGRGPDAASHERRRGLPVQRPHRVDRTGQIGRRRPTPPISAHEDPCPQALGQDEDVTGLCPTLAQEAIGMGGTDDREAVLRFGIADRVTARERAAGLADLGRGALEDGREHVPRQLLGERRDRQGEQDAATHREHVAQRVRGRDLAERPRIVDQRGKEIERADDGQIVADPIRGGVVGRVETRDQRVRSRLAREPTERIRQQVGPELGGAAAAIGQRGEPGWGRGAHVERGHRPMIGQTTRATIERGSGGVPVGLPVFKTGDAALGVAWWVRLPRAPAIDYRRPMRYRPSVDHATQSAQRRLAAHRGPGATRGGP